MSTPVLSKTTTALAGYSALLVEDDNFVAARLLQRLQIGAPLSLQDRRTLESAASSVRRVDSHQDLAKEGSPVDHIFLVAEGFACRYRLLPDGRRQITALMLPGDLCHIDTLALRHRNHSIMSLSPVEVGILTPEAVQRLQASPVLAAALAWNSVVQQSIAREWLVNVGRRTAFERLSHLICEMFERLQTVGLAQDGVYHFPLTQGELADTLALTPVHINRTLMDLRRRGLVTVQSRRVVIHDYPRLCKEAGFDRSYLNP
jgi:CRP-like cAMP-binding protein